MRICLTQFVLVHSNDPKPMASSSWSNWSCALWTGGVIYVATIAGHEAPSLERLETHRATFPQMWSPLPLKPAA